MLIARNPPTAGRDGRESARRQPERRRADRGS